jgi:hypothetical protein
VQTLFQITPLNWAEWKAVLLFSAPVVVIDEILKFVTVRCLSVNAGSRLINDLGELRRAAHCEAEDGLRP